MILHEEFFMHCKEEDEVSKKETGEKEKNQQLFINIGGDFNADSQRQNVFLDQELRKNEL